MALFQPKDHLISDDDIISNLPECIKQEILMYLPIKEAVRTCILSKSWRHIWHTIPDLVVESNMANEEHSKFIKFVDQLLHCHKGNIRKFRYFGPELCATVHLKWMVTLSEKHISELVLEFVPELESISSLLFSCLELKVLILSNCVFQPTTGFEGFRLLHTLELRNCLIPGDGVTRLISLCPLLQHLKLAPLFDDGVLKIHAPNLQELMICGNFAQMLLQTPKLRKANFIISPSVQQATCVELRGILIRSSLIINHILFGATHSFLIRKHLPTLNFLTTMVTILERSEKHSAAIIYELFQAVPTLQKLIIFLPARSAFVPNAEKIRDQVFPGLSEVNIISYLNSETVFGFVKSILSIAPVLQRLTITAEMKICEDSKLNELHELSTTAEIIFNQPCSSYEGKFQGCCCSICNIFVW